MSYERSDKSKKIILETADIGATNTGAIGNWATYQDARDFHHIHAIVEIGTWDSTDDLDTCKLQQATSAAGANVKDLTTSASGGDYDTDNPVDADGDQVIFEVPTDKMDVDGGFRYVRVYCAETGNTGTDNVSGVLELCGARHKKAELQATAATGSKVYVRT
jgi:hypothetical protein